MSTVEQLSDSERVVVTGMGAVTPLGPDVRSSWEKLIDGGHGIVPTAESPISAYPDYEKLGAKVVGAVQDFALPAEFKECKIRVDQNNMHRSALLGVTAVYEALKDADLLNDRLVIDDKKVNPFRTGLYMGSTFSGSDHSTEAMARDVFLPSDLFKKLLARVATSTAMQYNTKNLTPLLGWECASGAVVADIGARSLMKYRSDMPPVSDVVVVGGADAPLTPGNLRYFGALQVAVSSSTNPEEASRPFDQQADGLVMGEAGGALVLETLAHAKARGLKTADIKAELVGYASFTDAESKTRAGAEGAVRALVQAATMGYISVKKAVYFNDHGTSTVEGDRKEALITDEAVKSLGLDYNEVWVNSSKRATGHTMGAAGAIEAIWSILALNNKIIPPARNLFDPITEIRRFNLSPHRSTKLPSLNIAISNSLGFGGGVTSLAFREFED